MDGELVSESLSSRPGGGGGNRPAPRFAYTEKFYQVFPYYLAIGMTYEQFWEMDCDLVKYYRKAARIRQDLKNQDAWLQGMYVYQAVGNLAPILRAFAKKGAKPQPYPEQPFELNVRQDKKVENTKEKKQDDKAKAYMQMFAMSFNKKFQGKGGGVNGR